MLPVFFISAALSANYWSRRAVGGGWVVWVVCGGGGMEGDGGRWRGWARIAKTDRTGALRRAAGAINFQKKFADSKNRLTFAVY